MPETIDTLMCPFCRNGYVIAKPGKVKCHECGSRFEIDDRLECIFSDPDNIRLPVTGIVCSSCGLVQGGDHQKCLYCGTRISIEIH